MAAKNHTREIRAQKQNHEQTHRYVPYRQNTVPIGAILLRNLAFFAVGRPHCPRDAFSATRSVGPRPH